LFNPVNAGDWLPYFAVIIAEGLIMFQAAMAYWTILAGGYNPRDFRYHLSRRNLFLLGEVKKPSPDSRLYLNGRPVDVDVFVTAYGEPVETIASTVRAAKNIVGKHSTYVLDDGNSDAVKKLAQVLGVEYIRREKNLGAKAGNINNALKQAKGEFYAIFDADHIPKPSFLQETLPFFVGKTVAFVQTPQFYTNTHNPIAKGAAYAQELFYKFICTGKNRFNAAFCVGTNVIFRRSAIDEIGGMYQASKSEDIWTSLILHEHGYKSVFIPDVLAEGQAPETIPAYAKQQLRWATGGFEILLKHNPMLSKKLNFDQKTQYFTTVTFYLLGVASALLFLVPPLSIFLGMTPVSGASTLGQWASHYLAFYALQFAVIIYCMHGLKFEALVLATASFPTYLKALWNVLRGRDVGWQATNSKSAESPYNYIVPQVVIFVFLAVCSVVGILDVLVHGHQISLALLWNIFNTYLFGYYIRLAHSNRTKRVKAGEQDSQMLVAEEFGA
jgi:cellulose synthase (UDP-forming)